MKVDAIVLAGARNDGKLQEVSSCSYEAQIPVLGRAMICYVLDALKSTPMLHRIVVVGPKDLASEIGDLPLVESVDSLSTNIRKGVEYLQPERMVLLVTSDIPLIRAEVIEDFLRRCSELDGELFYPIVSKEANEKYYPGVARTYVTLREGVFTGGNLLLLSPRVVRECHAMIKRVVALRKQPWKLSSVLGVSFIVKFFLKTLRICEIERRVNKVFGVLGVGVILPYPEVGIDVDKPSDWELVEKMLEGSGKAKVGK